MLDEPTNDLDVDTLRALENALLNFAGQRDLHMRIAAIGTIYIT